MMALGFEPSDDEIDKMVQSIDTDGNSQLEFTEFMEMMNGKMVTPRNSTRIRVCQNIAVL